MIGNIDYKIAGKLVFKDILMFNDFKGKFGSKRVDCQKPMTVIFRNPVEVEDNLIHKLEEEYGSFIDTEKSELMGYVDDGEFSIFTIRFDDNGANLEKYETYEQFRSFIGSFVFDGIINNEEEWNNLIEVFRFGETKSGQIREEIENLMKRV